MSQYGMQMPGGQVRRGKDVDVYTGLLLIAAAVLLGATGFLFLQGQKIGPDGNPLGVHSDNGELKLADR